MSLAFEMVNSYEIHGVSGVELSAGLHWYLKNWCAAHISWDKTGGAPLSSVPKPGSLPKMNPNGILIRRLIPWSYYQNAVLIPSSTPEMLPACGSPIVRLLEDATA
ncbi:hypothetical protein KSP40_PGU004954 [Platanthera guangdongensis]|uniref:Alpha-N-acetylglucosaminidase N-terminal domain-containing protein n=1 Tax=Platanthera guangdongensis TaxID=2320717 RepID=A0ABR2MHP1_9ASPA